MLLARVSRLALAIAAFLDSAQKGFALAIKYAVEIWGIRVQIWFLAPMVDSAWITSALA